METSVQRLQREMGAARGSSEDDQDQHKAGQQLALSGSSGCDEGIPASSLELDLPRIRGEEQGSQDERKRPLSSSPRRRPMDEEEDVAEGDL